MKCKQELPVSLQFCFSWSVGKSYQAGKRSATDGTVHIQYSLWMWQKLHWRKKQTSSRVALSTQAHLQQGLLEKSKLAQHAYEEGHWIGWNDVRILEIESNSRYRKYKELAHMACLPNPISQPSLDISPIWIPLVSNEVSNSQRKSVWHDRFSTFVHKFVSSVRV
jgi:hypothetical protein